MWKFKPFAQKEPTGLEGRIVDVGDIKVHIKNVIAEGGFSSVYLAKDASNPSKQYALKYIICNDQESLDLAKKEIAVLKLLKGHPNVVNLYSSTILDMGRMKEVLLVMEFCEKSLVNVLESRGAAYFDEKQVLTIFRDVCNAVFAMHCHSPPIAHRDLKAENLLLSSDGSWKLCDFGSTSTNHKRFDKPEEMGIEEDIIRKHTTPAYRAPEMWDLYRRDVINEKVDIWALGCLLYRISFLKSAFDGESKLQILNGNYRIPELPKFSACITDLIRDMLHSSPDLRPDITQVWFRVNEQLPVGSQKSLPDRPLQMREVASDITAGFPKNPTSSTYPMPRRSPPPVPSSSESTRNISSSGVKGGIGAPGGAFWSTEHAKDPLVEGDKGAPESDDDFSSLTENRSQLDKLSMPGKATHSGKENSQAAPLPRKDLGYVDDRFKGVESESFATFENDAFNTFVADFDTSKLISSVGDAQLGNDNSVETEIERLRGQLKQANLEKAEVTAKYEKLSAICRSQRQELQELRQALTPRTLSPNKESISNQSPANPQSKRSQGQGIEGAMLDLQQGLLDKNTRTPESKPWQPFADDNSTQKTVSDPPKSVGTRSTGDGNSQRFGDSNKLASKTAAQPAGWAGF